MWLVVCSGAVLRGYYEYKYQINTHVVHGMCFGPWVKRREFQWPQLQLLYPGCSCPLQLAVRRLQINQDKISIDTTCQNNHVRTVNNREYSATVNSLNHQASWSKPVKLQLRTGVDAHLMHTGEHNVSALKAPARGAVGQHTAVDFGNC
jgi:hypothetical protein